MSDRPTFENLDLSIGQGEGGLYPLSVLSSPAGETEQPVRVPIDYDDEAMMGWLQGLEDGLIERDELQALGRRLADYLLPSGPVRDRYQRSLGLVEARGLRLRLRLRVSAAELARIPWEYVYDDAIDDFMSLNPHTVLVRYHAQPLAPRGITSRLPVPVLVMVSSPSSRAKLDVGQETAHLVQALEPLLDAGQARIDLLFAGEPREREPIAGLLAGRPAIRLLPDPASIDALRDALRQEYRILHYVGHGAFDERRGGLLLLAGEGGVESLIDAAMLARELRGSSVAVVVLNACQSAAGGTGRSFMGLAPGLIRAGVPAVVAMQFAIADSSAAVFAGAMYRALADGWPLDSAVTEGRKAIGAHSPQEHGAWGVPVLFMRSPDGVLWTEEPAGRERKPGAPPGAPEKAEVGERSGGVSFYDRAQVRGDVAGRDIHKVTVQAPGGLAPDERAEIQRLLARLENELASLDLPEDRRLVGQEFVQQLEHELTGTGQPPDASTIKVAGEWLLRNIPALAGALSSLFLDPAVGKVVGAAGDVAVHWVRVRFGRLSSGVDGRDG